MLWEMPKVQIFFYVACGVDSSSRAFPFFAGSDPSMTPQRCYTYCIQKMPSTTYFAVQYTNQCFCTSNYIPLNQGLAISSCCTSPCVGNSNIICGGTWCNSVYKLASVPAYTVLANVADERDTSQETHLPTWVIPVAVVGGIVVVVLISVVIFLLVKKSQPVRVDDYLKASFVGN